jgi:hypothetical protein
MRNWLLILAFFALTFEGYSQMYRTRTPAASTGSGNWATASIWETSTNGTNWTNATTPPDQNASTIEIRSSSTVTINATTGSVTADQLTINGTLTISGGSLTINDGSGTDLTNASNLNLSGGTLTLNGTATTSATFTISGGTLNVIGTLANSGTLTGSTASITTFQSASRYRKLNTTDLVPLATWVAGSTLEIAGFTNNFTATNASWNQAYSNVEINLTGLSPSTRIVNFNSQFSQVGGNLSVISTGGVSGGKIAMGSASIAGNFSTSANTRTDFAVNGTSHTISITGSLTNSGTLQMTNANGNATLNLQGDLSVPTGGILTTNTAGGVTGQGTINFIRTGVQNFSRAGTISNFINYNVTSTSILDIAGSTNSLAGSGTLTVSGEIRLGSTHSNGALQSGNSTGSNIQNTGTRTYNSGSTITYNGLAGQVVGNGHPGATFPGVNLTVNTTSLGYAAAVNTLQVTGNLRLQSTGSLNVGANKTLILDGNLLTPVNGTITVTGTSDIIVNGTGAFGTFPFPSGDQSFSDLTVSRNGGSLTLGNNVTLSGTLSLDEGDLVFNGQTLTLDGSYSANTGLFSSDASSTLSIGGTGAFGTLAFASGGNFLNTLTLNRSGGTATLSGSLTVVSDINLISGSLTNSGGLVLANGATIHRYADGALLSNRIANGAGDSYNVEYLGTLTTGLELPDPTDTDDLNNLTVTNGPVTLSQDIIVNGNFTINGDSFDAATQTITMQGANWDLNGGSFVPGSSSVVFDGITNVTGVFNFNNVQVNASRTVTFPALVTVAGNLVFASSSTYNHSSGNVRLDGISTQTVDANSKNFYVLEVNKLAGAVNLSSGLRIIRLLDIQSGTVFNSAGHLRLLSTGEETENDASIGPLLNGAAVTGNVVKERFMSAKGNVNRYISSPATGVAVSQLQDDFAVYAGSLRYYNEPTAGAIGNGYVGWPIGNTLQVGRGYLVWMYSNTAANWDVSATMNQGNITLPVTYTTTSGGVAADGWNLVGNPYPSAIVWDGGPGWTLTNIDPTISVPDFGAGGTYPTYYKTYNYIDDTGHNLPGGIIASGQAFWVHVTSSATSGIIINENAKTSAAGGMFYRKRTTAKSSQLMISIDNGQFEDNSFLKLNPNASEAYDPGYDAVKLKNEEMNIYLVDRDGKELVMHTLKEITDKDEIRLGITVKEPGQYNIAFYGHSEFPPAGELFLYDREENQSIPVSAGVSYTFAVNEEGRFGIHNRFYLSKTKKSTGYESVLVYPNPVTDFVHVSAPYGEGVSVSLFNGAGALVHHTEQKVTDTIDMRNFNKGIYVLKLHTSRGVVVKKITKQ